MDASETDGRIALEPFGGNASSSGSALYAPEATCYAGAMSKGIAPDPLFADDVLGHADALHHFASYLCRDAVAAEDLVQETFARCFSAHDRFRKGTDLKAWLFRILRNAFIDGRRRS